MYVAAVCVMKTKVTKTKKPDEKMAAIGIDPFAASIEETPLKAAKKRALKKAEPIGSGDETPKKRVRQPAVSGRGLRLRSVRGGGGRSDHRG